MSNILNNNNINNILDKLDIRPRPDAGHGLWLMFLLPSCLIISAIKQPVVLTETYKIAAILSVGIIITSVQICNIAQNTRGKDALVYKNAQLVGSTLCTVVLLCIFLHTGLVFALCSALIPTFFYCYLFFYVLKSFPRSFTLGEAAVCSQGLSLFFYFACRNIYQNFQSPKLGPVQISTFILQLGILGVLLIAKLVQKFHIKNQTTFLFVAGFVFIFVVLLPVHVALDLSPLLFIFNLFYEDFQSKKIVLLWVVFSVIAVVAVRRQITLAKKASSGVRKIFHILSIVVFISGLLHNCTLLYLASGVVLGVFIVLETIRIANISPLANSLEDGFAVFADQKDAGIVALTPLYLLAGCAMPIWIHPAPCDVSNSGLFNFLPLCSGLLTIGIGDTAASVIGSNFGKHKWKDSMKSVEGTIACILSQILLVHLLIHFDCIKALTTVGYMKVGIGIFTTSIVEAKTDQVDNLVLPLLMYIILI